MVTEMRAYALSYNFSELFIRQTKRLMASQHPSHKLSPRNEEIWKKNYSEYLAQSKKWESH